MAQQKRLILTTSTYLFWNGEQCHWSVWKLPDAIMIANILLNLDRQSLMLTSHRQNSPMNQ